MSEKNKLDEVSLKTSGVTPMKSIRLISSAKSTWGASRVVELLPAFCFQVDSAPENASADDVILAHNTVKVPKALRANTIFYALQSLVKVILKDEEISASFRDQPPLAIFTNTETAASDLRKHGISASAIYRPNKLALSKGFVPLPERPRILLYWKADHPPMAHQHKAVEALIKSLPDVEFWTFPDAEPPTDAPNVKALGRVEFSKVLPHVDGMVRISDRYDYGRSTFDVLAQGRWVVYNDMPDEKFSLSAPLEEMAEFVRKLINERSDEAAAARHAEISAYFNEEALRNRWAKIFEPLLANQALNANQQLTLSEFCTGRHEVGKVILSVDRLSGRISAEAMQGHCQIRSVSRKISREITDRDLLLDAGLIYELISGPPDQEQSWKFLAGKSPKGYFITKPMPTAEFELCDGIHGFLHPEQGLALYHAASVAGREKSLVEIGAYHGKSTNYLATGAAPLKSHVFSVDTFENHAMTEGAMQTLDFYKKNTAKFYDSVHPIKGFSHDVVEQTPEIVDYLFIDGDHSIRGCSNDIKHYFHRVAEGGIIAFDDYFDKSQAKRVKTVLDYFVELGVFSFVTEFRRHAITVKNQTTAVVSSSFNSDVGKEVLDTLRSSGLRAFHVSAEILGETESINPESIMIESALHAATDVISLNHVELSAQIRSRCTLLLLGSTGKKVFSDVINIAGPAAPAFREVIVADKELAEEAQRCGINVRLLPYQRFLEEVGRL